MRIEFIALGGVGLAFILLGRVVIKYIKDRRVSRVDIAFFIISSAFSIYMLPSTLNSVSDQTDQYLEYMPESVKERRMTEADTADGSRVFNAPGKWIWLQLDLALFADHGRAGHVMMRFPGFADDSPIIMMQCNPFALLSQISFANLNIATQKFGESIKAGRLKPESL